MPRKTSVLKEAEAVSTKEINEIMGATMLKNESDNPLDEVLKDVPYEERENDMVFGSPEVTYPEEPELANNEDEIIVSSTVVESPKENEDLSYRQKFLNFCPVNWEGLIPKEYFYTTEEGQKIVKVQGLYDLLNLVGFDEFTSYPDHVIQGLVVVTATLKIGKRMISAVADATPENCGTTPFNKFLSTIADTRAKGRAIRQAFNIHAIVEEELSAEDRKRMRNHAVPPSESAEEKQENTSPLKKSQAQAKPQPQPVSEDLASPKQVKFVGDLMKKSGLTIKDVLRKNQAILERILSRANNNVEKAPIFLTRQEANKIIEALKPAEKKQDAQ